MNDIGLPSDEIQSILQKVQEHFSSATSSRISDDGSSKAEDEIPQSSVLDVMNQRNIMFGELKEMVIEQIHVKNIF